MNILLSEQMFLVISFVLALWLLYKFAYKKLNKQIEKSIEDIRGTITNNEKAKKNAEDAIKKMRLEIERLEKSAQAEEANARKETKISNDNNNKKIEHIILEKNREYEDAKLALERNFFSKAQKEYIENVIHTIRERLESVSKDKSFQEKAIERSLNMLEEYIEANER